MAQIYTPKELQPYRGLFYDGTKRTERHGCDKLFEECSKIYSDCGSVEEFIRQSYLNLSAKRNNLVMISGQIPSNSSYAKNLKNIEIILDNIERANPEVKKRA